MTLDRLGQCNSITSLSQSRYIESQSARQDPEAGVANVFGEGNSKIPSFGRVSKFISPNMLTNFCLSSKQLTGQSPRPFLTNNFGVLPRDELYRHFGSSALRSVQSVKLEFSVSNISTHFWWYTTAAFAVVQVLGNRRKRFAGPTDWFSHFQLA